MVRRLKSDRQVTAGVQTLQERSGSGLATIPHDFLERDDVIDDGEFPDEQNLVVDRLDRRVYLVRLTDDGSIPDVEEAEAIQRIAAQHLLQGGALGHESTAESEEEPAARRLM